MDNAGHEGNTQQEGEGVVEIFTPYQCGQCKEVFLSESERDDHVRLQHGGEAEAEAEMEVELQQGEEEEEETEARLQCHDCPLVFSDHSALLQHYRAEHSKEGKQIPCQMCVEVFPNEAYLQYHMLKFHSQPEEYKCSMCMRVCASETVLEAHKRVCPKNLFPCDFCSLRFPSRRAVHQHMKSTHRGPADSRGNSRAPPSTPAKKYNCLFCGKTFSRRQDMETHQRTHTGDKPFKCKTCGKGFVSNSELHHHLPTHSSVKAFRCQFCGIAYKNISTLTHHRRVKHLNPVKVPCPFPQCTYVGPSEKLLKCHVRTAHIEYKSHVCEQCGRAFSSLSHLYDHRRRKHDPGPAKSFPCEAPGCDKVFRKQFLADRHFKKEHLAGSEEFKCPKCSRAFGHEETLRQHFSTHRGSRFYYCPTCYTVTATEKGIVNHMAQCGRGRKEEDEDADFPDILHSSHPSGTKDENVQYEIVVDQLQPDPHFESISSEVAGMLMEEGGAGDREDRLGVSADDIAQADRQIAGTLTR